MVLRLLGIGSGLLAPLSRPRWAGVLWLLLATLPLPLALPGHAQPSTATEDAKRLQLAPGLQLSVWATEPLLSNSVAFSIDGQGRIFLAESHRWDISIFDITKHPNWLLEDLSFRTVADRAAFLSNEFATNLTFLTNDSEAVRLVEDRAGTGHADHSEILASGFNSVVDGTAAGVLATGTNLYFANIPNLWRLDEKAGESASKPVGEKTPSDPLAHLPTRSLLASGFGVHIGVSGHDLHGLIKGPDGRIYMSFGDRGLCLTNREGVVINLPDTGGVLRCEPDGRDLEVFCYGLRNPQELAFDDLGNLWTVDNDTAGADPCRVLHLVEGGDYGWRTSYQHMDGFGPWVQEELWKGGQDGILPPAGTVSQGPAGLAYYPGTGFGGRLAGTFLHCDFPGGVTAFTVKPRGASYVVDHQEKFLWNCWPTDVDFGPDGAAYVLDWVSGWGQPGKGRIYRITPGDVAADVRRLTSNPGSDGASSRRLLREAELVAQVKRLLAEGMAQRGEKELLDLLGHADRRVRLEAQWELAGRNAFIGLQRIATSSKAQPARLHAIWGIGQIARATYPVGFVRELAAMTPLIGDDDEIVAGNVMKMLGEARVINAQPAILAQLNSKSQWLLAKAISAHRELLKPTRLNGIQGNHRHAPDLELRIKDKFYEMVVHKPNPSLRFTVAVDTGDFVPVAGELAPNAPFVTHELVRLLTEHLLEIPFDSPVAGRHWSGNPDPTVRKIAALAYARVASPTITNFLADPDPRLVIAAGRAIHDVPIVEGFPALAAFLTRVDCPTNLMSRVIDACFRLGTPQHAQMLAGFAARADVPDEARVLALRALADWEKPSPLDRVNGLWRPLVNAERGMRNAELPLSSPAPSANPLLARAAQSAVRSPQATIPTLPADLGRSVSYEEAMALRRNPAPAQRAFLRVAGEIMNPTTPDAQGVVLGGPPAPVAVRLAVIDTAVRLRTKEASSPLFDEFTRSHTPPEIRRALVPALAALHAAQAGEAVKLALADPDPALRAAALPHLDRLEGADAVGVLTDIVAQASRLPSATTNDQAGRRRYFDLRLAQAAMAALAKLTDAPAATARRNFASELKDGRLPPELALDVHEAIQPQSAAATGFRDTLVGGDAARGRQIFFGNPTVQCSRCHAVGNEGGTVGPKLDGGGGRNPRAYLLESIVQPNAKIAVGFENVVITHRDGRSLAGTVKHETDDALTLEIVDAEAGTTNAVPLRKADLTQRQRGPSAMPEGLAAQLTPFELRDLVEFLASLK